MDTISATNRLTDRQRTFCQLLMTNPGVPDGDLYRRAYPSCRSAKGAGANAARLKKNPAVKAYLQEARESAEARFEVTQERIVRELVSIAFLDPLDVFEPDGILRPLDRINESSRRALAGIKVHRGPLISSSESDKDIKQVHFHDKLRALKMLATLLGFFPAKRQSAEENPFQQLLAMVQPSGRVGSCKIDLSVAEHSKF